MKEGKDIFVQIEYGRGPTEQVIRKALRWQGDALQIADESIIRLDIDQYLSILKEEYLGKAMSALKDYDKLITMKVMATLPAQDSAA